MSMPWKVCSARRNVFALRPISRQEDMSERTGSRISRKTGYNILSRYKEGRLCNHSPAGARHQFVLPDWIARLSGGGQARARCWAPGR
jgi:hypothetical protein